MKTWQSRSFFQRLDTRPPPPPNPFPEHQQATEKKQEAIEPRVSGIAHAALALTADVTHAQSEQLSGANKVAFIEETQQGGLTLHN